jgi:hypothetical protein
MVDAPEPPAIDAGDADTVNAGLVGVGEIGVGAGFEMLIVALKPFRGDTLTIVVPA